MRLDTNVASEAYCEGQYAVMKNKNGIYRLKYKGEGICSDDGDINIFYIKKVKMIITSSPVDLIKTIGRN